jgi:two-component system chemotaxis sensor kinase CheA
LAHRPTADATAPALPGSRAEVSQLLEYVEASQDWLREAGSLAGGLARRYAQDALQISLAIDELEEEIKRIRMLPLNTITAPFGRMVRDLARAAGKEAFLEIEGGETELDRQVLEQIKDPLIHLLRNAIDHGIEPPEAREAAGKPRAGRVTLRAGQQGPSVVVQVDDDGTGLDLPGLRRALARRGHPDAETLGEAELRDLILTARVSTSPIITDISGRGIGLSVVRRNVEALQGRVEVRHEPGQGATFTLTLPLTLTSARGLLLRAAGQTFALPLNAVEVLLAVAPEDVSYVEGQQVIRYGDRPVALVRLDDVLELPRNPAARPDRHLPVVVIAGERTVAFAVDELRGEQEMVIKGLGRQLRRVVGLAGATVLGSGEVVLILSASDLVKLALRSRQQRPIFEPEAGAGAGELSPPRRRILVVDDSITTRTLEKNILEAAGYDVALATDGREALGLIASQGLPDLVVSDILMPHMNGFELTERLKGDDRTAGLPVILVSSLASPGDKVRGIEAGADAYIVKGQFDQTSLLETIEQLI